VDPWIILSAHHCAPGMGSEHAVGWNLLVRLAARHRLLLITQDNEFRPALERELRALGERGLVVRPHFVKHGSRTDGRKNNLRLLYYVTYALYQWRVYRLARRLCAEHDVGAVHHLTIVGFREPGFLWLLDKPFIWGPVGGLVFAPVALFGLLSPKMKAFQAIRNVLTALQFHSSPRVALAYWRTGRSGGRFIAATHEIGRRFVRRFGGRYVRVPETGATLAPATLRGSAAPKANRLRLLWVGALIDIKPLGLLLDAIAAMPDGGRSVELDVVGDGDSGPEFRSRAARLGVSATFHGWIEHGRVQSMYAGADLFVLFSLKDLTTNVVFEALSHELPVLCLDHHGYSEIVDRSCGFKIPITTRSQVTEDVAALLTRLARSPAELEGLRIGALARAREFTWDRNAEALSELYAGARP
jgi:glycosyltransferase involved in cell wall biosynthesis